jgi:hypothetical protein
MSMRVTATLAGVIGSFLQERGQAIDTDADTAARRVQLRMEGINDVAPLRAGSTL